MDAVSATRIAPRQEFLHAEETLSRDELASLQLKRLRAMLDNLAASVPPMRERLRAAGVEGRDIATLDDVARLPFTQKTDLRDHYPFGLFARSPAKLARLHASSGTTGKPTVVGYPSGDICRWCS